MQWFPTAYQGILYTKDALTSVLIRCQSPCLWQLFLMATTSPQQSPNNFHFNKPHISHVRFEVFMAVTMKNAIFWDVVLCRSCVNRRFAGLYRLHLQGGCSHLLTLVSLTRIFLPWRWRRYVPPKRQFTQDLHSATSQKTAFLIFHNHQSLTIYYISITIYRFNINNLENTWRVLWDIMPYSPLKVKRCFGGTCCLHLQCSRISQAK
jgi:hypothetical protein